jgi:hypothetical protein
LGVEFLFLVESIVEWILQPFVGQFLTLVIGRRLSPREKKAIESLLRTATAVGQGI